MIITDILPLYASSALFIGDLLREERGDVRLTLLPGIQHTASFSGTMVFFCVRQAGGTTFETATWEAGI